MRSLAIKRSPLENNFVCVFGNFLRGAALISLGCALLVAQFEGAAADSPRVLLTQPDSTSFTITGRMDAIEATNLLQRFRTVDAGYYTTIWELSRNVMSELEAANCGAVGLLHQAGFKMQTQGTFGTVVERDGRKYAVRVTTVPISRGQQSPGMQKALDDCIRAYHTAGSFSDTPTYDDKTAKVTPNLGAVYYDQAIRVGYVYSTLELFHGTFFEVVYWPRTEKTRSAGIDLAIPWPSAAPTSIQFVSIFWELYGRAEKLTKAQHEALLKAMRRDR